MVDCALRSAFHRLRDLGDDVGLEIGRRQSADAGNRGRRARRRAGLPEAPVPDDRPGRHRHLRAVGLLPWTPGGDRLPDRRGAVRRRRLHRDERLGPRQCAHGAGRDHGGDCAGMAAGLFETYAVTAVATMVLAAIFFATSPLLVNMMTLPLAIGGACIITSIIGTFFVKLGANQSIMGALYKGLIATGILSLIGVAGVIYLLVGFGPLAGVKFTGMALFECGIVGLVVTGLIIWITEYYTGTENRPVKSIAASSVTGHGTNVIQGLAISMESTAGPALVIIAGILVTYNLAGLFGIAIATTTMLALAGMIVALDAFGPVTDNAGGIAALAGLPKEVRNP